MYESILDAASDLPAMTDNLLLFFSANEVNSGLFKLILDRRLTPSDPGDQCKEQHIRSSLHKSRNARHEAIHQQPRGPDDPCWLLIG